MSHHPKDELSADSIVLVALVVAQCFGIVLDSWLWWLCGRGQALLLKRQLRHQAFANLCFYVVAIGFKIWGLMSVSRDCLGEPNFLTVAMKDRYLFVLKNFLMHGLLLVSCFMEVHIAASMLAISRRATRSIQHFSCTVPWVWMLALLMNLLSFTFSSSWRRVADEGGLYERDMTGAVTNLVCCVSICVFYGFALVAVGGSNAPGVAIQRSSRRALAYPAIFILTTLPLTLRMLGYVELCSVTWAWSIFFEDLFGPLTAIAYLTLNAGCRSDMLSQRSSRTELSLQPGSPANSSWTPFSTTADPVRHAVGFATSAEELSFVLSCSDGCPSTFGTSTCGSAIEPSSQESWKEDAPVDVQPQSFITTGS